MIQDVARKRGAEGSADADCAADDAEPKVEPSGAVHDVRNDKRENDPENGGADSIEELHGDDQIGTAYQRKECRPQRKGRQPPAMLNLQRTPMPACSGIRVIPPRSNISSTNSTFLKVSTQPLGFLAVRRTLIFSRDGRSTVRCWVCKQNLTRSAPAARQGLPRCRLSG